MIKLSDAPPHRATPNKVGPLAFWRHGWIVDPKREADGKLWSPASTEVILFSREQLFALIAAPHKPLRGHHVPPEQLDELSNAAAPLEHYSTTEVVGPWHVYGALNDLWSAFEQVQLRAGRVYTRDRFNRAQGLTKRLRSALKALQHPMARGIVVDERLEKVMDEDWWIASGRHLLVSADDLNTGELFDKFVTECGRFEKRYAWIADALERKLERDAEQTCSNLEEFVRDPLRYAYLCLYGSPASANVKGPFLRFARQFFRMVEHPVKASTIASHVRGRKRRKLKRKRSAP